jgi:hypothetical protein
MDDILQMLNDTGFIPTILEQHDAAARAYIKRRAEALRWTPVEYEEVLCALFAELRPVRRDKPPRSERTP